MTFEEWAKERGYLDSCGEQQLSLMHVAWFGGRDNGDIQDGLLLRLCQAEDALKALETDSIHSCHAECQRLECVQRRRIEALTFGQLRTCVTDWAADKGIEQSLAELLLARIYCTSEALQTTATGGE